MAEYCISCCSTADLTKEYFDKRGIRYVCFHYELGGTDYLDDLGQTMPPAELYRRMWHRKTSAQTLSCQAYPAENDGQNTYPIAQGLTLSSCLCTDKVVSKAQAPQNLCHW